MGLHEQAAGAALADAGLAAGDVDGVLCAYSMTEPHLMLSSVFCEYFGIAPAYSSAIQAGGATAAIMVMHAAALVTSGICRHVLCVCVRRQPLSGHDPRPRGRGARRCRARAVRAPTDQRSGVVRAGGAALHARVRSHSEPPSRRSPYTIATTTRGATPRRKCAIRSAARAMTALFIADPCGSTTAARSPTAVVVNRRDAWRPAQPADHGRRLRSDEHPRACVRRTVAGLISGCKQSSARAFAMAGVTAADIDVAEIYDSFTITLLGELESIGFFGRGEAGPAALGNALDLGGPLPCNTHGGCCPPRAFRRRRRHVPHRRGGAAAARRGRGPPGRRCRARLRPWRRGHSVGALFPGAREGLMSPVAAMLQPAPRPTAETAAFWGPVATASCCFNSAPIAKNPSSLRAPAASIAAAGRLNGASPPGRARSTASPSSAGRRATHSRPTCPT